MRNEPTVRLAEQLGVTPDRSGFLQVPEADLLAAQGGGSATFEGPTADDLLALLRAMDGSLPLGPVVDGDLHRSVGRGGHARWSGSTTFRFWSGQPGRSSAHWR